MSETDTYRNVWERLIQVDISEHTEEKMGLTFLSWSWAWKSLMENYPDSTFEFAPTEFLPDGSAMVECTVTIQGVERTMWLPVMDHRNKAISNPSSRDVSDARMRCLVKVLGIFGLGIGLYLGLPADEQPTHAEIETGGNPDPVDTAKLVLGATEVPGFSEIGNATTYDELKDVFQKFSPEWKALSPLVYDEMRKRCTERKQKITN